MNSNQEDQEILLSEEESIKKVNHILDQYDTPEKFAQLAKDFTEICEADYGLSANNIYLQFRYKLLSDFIKRYENEPKENLNPKELYQWRRITGQEKIEMTGSAKGFCFELCPLN
jgi:hypothetical protein